jgi:hypothetical protein
MTGMAPDSVLERFAALRQHQKNGQRSPHKPPRAEPLIP